MSITRQELPNEPEVDLEDYRDNQIEIYLKEGMALEDAEIKADEDCIEEERYTLECRRCCPNGCRGLC